MARLIATRCLVLLIATFYFWVCAAQNLDDFSIPLKTKPNFSLETVLDKDTTLLNFNFTANGQNLEPPRNVTDFFKGQWSQLAESSTWRISSDEKETINPFGRHSGVLVFQLNTKPSPLTYVDIVQGDLLIRDGMWSTDGNKRYNLQGLYFWDTGDLFMLANPLSKPVIQDFDVSLTNESTIRDVLAKAEGMIANIDTSQDKDKEEDKQEGDQCFWKILFKAKPVFAFENDVLKQPNGNRAPNKPTLDVKGIMHSPNCKVALVSEATTILFDAYYRKATNYVLMVTIISCIQIWLTIRQMESTTTQTSAAKVSLLTIGMQAIMDSYLSLLHLTAGIIVESVFNPYATASFVKFILFSIFEMRYLLFIFKARNPQTFAAGWNVIRRKLSQFYMRFYGVIFLGFVLIYYFNGLFIVLLFSLYSLWIPQIICNATQDTDHALSKKYIIGMTVTRLCIPLYFYGCPKNFVHAEPDFTLVSYLVAYLITQVGVLLMQDVLGPRWFIPKRFLPEKYNYRRSYEPDPETGLDRECVICMNTVKASDRDYMITPCNHVFHDECLRQWMALKMECPTCRGQLPYP